MHYVTSAAVTCATAQHVVATNDDEENVVGTLINFPTNPHTWKPLNMRIAVRIPLPQMEMYTYHFSTLCEMCVCSASRAFYRQIWLFEHLKGKNITHYTRTQSSCPFYATTFRIQILLPYVQSQRALTSHSTAIDKWFSCVYTSLKSKRIETIFCCCRCDCVCSRVR